MVRAIFGTEGRDQQAVPALTYLLQVSAPSCRGEGDPSCLLLLYEPSTMHHKRAILVVCLGIFFIYT